MGLIGYNKKNWNQDPNKIYCFAIKRNPNNEKRTSFNDNKSRLLRPNLYFKFKDDKTVSFCYSSDVQREKTYGEIINNFSNRSKNWYFKYLFTA